MMAARASAVLSGSPVVPSVRDATIIRVTVASRSGRWSIDAWLGRAYERNGRAYLRALYGWLGAALLLLTSTAASSVPAHFLRASLEEYLIAVLLLQAATVASMAFVAFMLRRPTGAIARWAAGEREARLAGEVSVAAYSVPRRALLFAAPGAFLLQIPVATLAAMVLTDSSGSGLFWEIYFGGAWAALFSGLIIYVTLELGYRPLRASLARSSPPPGPPSGLGTRLLLALLSLPMVAGIFAGGLNVEHGNGSLWAVYGLSFGATAAGVGVLTILLTSSVLGPIRDLIGGTRAIGDGELGTRVPVTGDDELAMLTGSFNEMAAELQAARARVVTVSDDARRQVERDLHDGAQQHLVMLSIKLAMLERRLADLPQAALAAEARADLNRAMAELRDLAHGIYPALLTSDGLAAALYEVVAASPIEISFEADGVSGRYPPELEAAVYFCCLEGLQNAAKHAGAGATASIRLSEATGALSFEIEDDGVGFDPAKSNGSIGLNSMRDRVGALGGVLRVRSGPGAGTTIAGTVPIAVRGAMDDAAPREPLRA